MALFQEDFMPAMVLSSEHSTTSQVNIHCISVRDAARYLGIGVFLAKKMAADGRLPTIKLGTRRVVPVAVLETMVAAKVAEAHRLVSAPLEPDR
jgi:excisionase family DNA binding protein